MHNPRPGRKAGKKGRGQGQGRVQGHGHAQGQGSLNRQGQQKSKEPKDWYHYCLYNCGYFLWPLSPTQSITNGEMGENPDETVAMRGGPSGAHGSRDGSGERTGEEPEYNVIQTQPRQTGKRPISRRHTVGGRVRSRGETREDSLETERNKETFMDLLATRYPQFADKISTTNSEDGFPVRGRSRDPRRRATVVSYNPQHNRSLEYDDVGTMSEVDGTTFHRGGFVRSSLPATRSPPTALEKPLGLVFLIFRDETKKALLPNEITHLDTVRALFVRSFPGKLTMSFLESPKRKIYLLDPRTNIYYQLEDLRDVKDRAVLRVHETDSHEPQRLVEKPEVRGRTIQMPASAITSQVQKAQPLPLSMQPIYVSHDNVIQSPARTSYERSRSLTPDPSKTAGYAPNPIYGRMGISPERPPPPQERTIPPDRPPPPVMLRTIPENHLMLNGIKNGSYTLANGGYYAQLPGVPGPTLGSRSHPQYPRQAMSPPAIPTVPRQDPVRRAFSPPPNLQNYDYVQQVVTGSQGPPGAPQDSGTYMAKVVRASTHQAPQRATSAPSPTTSQGQGQGQVHPTWRERSPVGRHSFTLPPSGARNNTQRSQSYRVPSTSDREPLLITRPRSMTPQPLEVDTREQEFTMNRIDRMEAQLANLATWVQTAVVQSSSSTGAPSSVRSGGSRESESPSPLIDSASSKVEVDQTDSGVCEKGLSDLASEGTATLSADMKTNILAIKHQADCLRSDLRSLRRLQQINKESIMETVDDAWKKIRKALASVPGAEHLFLRQQRNEVDVMYQIYLDDKAHADKELADLEKAVEELRSDVLTRQCRVQMSDVEGMALVLSHVTRALGELKARFPRLQEQLKTVMAAEMEVIVLEEKFLKEEPERLDNSLKKCKKLTGTLFTLKRLASVQEHRPPQVVSLPGQARITTQDDRRAVLENIMAVIPNHDARLQSLQAAESSRERKKHISTRQEALRFGKSLELATKALKSSSTPAIVGSGEEFMAGLHPSSSDPIPVTMGSDTSSVISFACPMGTSTPKSVGLLTTSDRAPSREYSSSSPSIAYPVMSLVRTVSPGYEPSTCQGQGHCSVTEAADRYCDPSERHAAPTSEPAVLPVTSHKSRQTGSKISSSKKASTPVELYSMKGAARAEFFSSLESPITPTTTTTMSPLPASSAQQILTDSPTEGQSKSATGGSRSPVRGIPSLVRSVAVTTSSVIRSQYTSSSTVLKPSSLPMSGSVSAQKFSPASPSSVAQSGSSKLRSIPKPYSPTKTVASPITPESPKYRISSNPFGEKKVVPVSKDLGTKPKKVPPPPPPRKSSRLPGHAVAAVNAATVNGGLVSKHTELHDKYTSRSKVQRQKELLDRGDLEVIDPPKQFASPGLDTKVESKTSVGPLKQFSAPILESRRDEKYLKKISKSNMDSSEKKSKLTKDIDIVSEKHTSPTKSKIKKDDIVNNNESDDAVPKVDWKVSNIDDGEVVGRRREGSGDSSSSSSSLDSQPEAVWLKQEHAAPTTSSSATPITSEDTTTTTSASASTSASTVSTSASSSPKKPKPPPPERRSSLTSKSKTEQETEEETLPQAKSSEGRHERKGSKSSSDKKKS